jgi:hypothetical protein
MKKISPANRNKNKILILYEKIWRKNLNFFSARLTTSSSWLDREKLWFHLQNGNRFYKIFTLCNYTTSNCIIMHIMVVNN